MLRARPLRALLVSRGGMTYSSSRVRALAHRQALRRRGVALCAPYDHALVERTLAGKALARLVAHALAPWVEIIWLQKRPLHPAWLRRLQRAGKRVLFDLDDAIYLRGWPWVDEMIALADRVLCGSEEILAYCALRNAQCHLLPTGVDARAFHPRQRAEGEPVVIGWTGSRDTLPYLESLADVLREVLARHEPTVALWVMCDRRPSLPGVAYHYQPWSLAAEPAFCRRFDIGLMPLFDDPWARAKCAYKALLAMAVGAPAVVSPVGANATVVRHGVDGFHAADAESWREALERLITDPALRACQGAAGRQRVLEDYSYDVFVERLVALLKEW